MTTKLGDLGAGVLTQPEKETRPLSNYWKALVPALAGAVLLLLPIPEGLKLNAWCYFALFVAVIIALILEPIRRRRSDLSASPPQTVSLLIAPKPADAIKWALLAGVTGDLPGGATRDRRSLPSVERFASTDRLTTDAREPVFLQ